MQKTSFSLLLLSVFTLLTPRAEALPGRQLSLDVLVRSADLVAEVEVLQSAGEWQTGRILTRHELRVASAWLGEASSRIELTTLGGVVGELGQRVSGQVTLRPGERLVVFAVWDPKSRSYRLRGGSNGVYRVVRGSDGTSRIRGELVPSPLVGAALPDLESLRRRVLELQHGR